MNSNKASPAKFTSFFDGPFISQNSQDSFRFPNLGTPSFYLSIQCHMTLTPKGLSTSWELLRFRLTGISFWNLGIAVFNLQQFLLFPWPNSYTTDRTSQPWAKCHLWFSWKPFSLSSTLCDWKVCQTLRKREGVFLSYPVGYVSNSRITSRV